MDFTGNVESTNLSRDKLSREIGRSLFARSRHPELGEMRDLGGSRRGHSR